ncbi:polyphosphate kinase 1 [Flavobacterium agricola]|uniref:Polyphosphate kinase n=1 Tax=Flavobacterium agricola TaxID=2870839 RepID=A0ABY6M1U9_9FLAO|nr:polyphosphate kinase 1 [Flavobacterium agricola]UYW02222.1 polyphosphate kinase 1 [Flavobacterium agricola]
MKELRLSDKYINRDLSWLAFNARVLQEAADISVPLLSRLRFLGIFSNNLDEFFRVRYATIRRMRNQKISGEKILGGISSKKLMQQITEVVIQQQAESLRILSDIEKQLEQHDIYIINETQLSQNQEKFVKEFFLHKVSNSLVTIMLNDITEFPLLRDTSGYLAIKMVLNPESPYGLQPFPEKRVLYAVIEIPTTINRFVEIPSADNKKYIILIDDIIRYNLREIFNMFDYKHISAHMIKITRDAELEIDSDLNKSFLEKIYEGVKDRSVGEPVRFVYDKEMDEDILSFLLNRMGIDATDSIIPGGRYHNRRDYMDFPNLGRFDLLEETKPALPVPGLSLQGSILKRIAEKDYLVHSPYQSYAYIIKFLREAALDPSVTSIKITLYRLSKHSQIISSLINAAKNGKKVTVCIELQARFDEASNINYSEIMQTEGIKLIFGVKGLKVHSKICVVERIENEKIKRYGFISTGNFNESTARFYTDVTLLTSSLTILKDVTRVFEFFETNYKIHRYKDLIVSPHYTRQRIYKLIEREIYNVESGREGLIKMKMNSLSDFKMIDKLYEASMAGVKIQLIIRGICCLRPQIPFLSENIEVISILDNYLEHTRLFIFGNSGNPEVFISSADLMTRNIDHRVEVICPIYDKEIKKELIETFDIGWSDNVKARIQSSDLANEYKVDDNPEKIRSQKEIYKYYEAKVL